MSPSNFSGLLRLPFQALPGLCRLLPAVALLGLVSAVPVAAEEPRRPECIAPASPGGGFDLTCKLAQSALLQAELLSSPMRVTYMPGGIGAVAYNAVAAQRSNEPGTIVAWSSGSLLNLAQGKFGRFDEHAVKWLSAIGTTYGALVVRADAPFQDLDDLVAALRSNPGGVVIGAGGTVGSQDWMQTALTARAAGIEPRAMRYVAMEGGGELITALLGGHIQVASSDIADAMPHVEAGDVRILAVFSAERLPGEPAAQVPTAIEQGYDIIWPVIRGFYVGPEVSDAAYDWWVGAFDTLLASEAFAELRAEREMYPFSMTGEPLREYVDEQVARYRQMATEFGLTQ